MMKVLKFGGTSVGSAERIKNLVTLVAFDYERIVVLSAMSGTTNNLVEIASAHSSASCKDLIATLNTKYNAVVKELYSTEGSLKKAEAFIQQTFEKLHSLVKEPFTSAEEKEILAQGELLSTTLFHYYLEEKGIDSVLLPALDFMRIDADEEPDSDYIEKHLGVLLQNHKGKKLFITQGFICTNHKGEIDNLKRGGSDYTASIVGAAVNAEEVQIWTDIDGMHNNDPRVVNKTHPIAQLSFNEAAELAYFGAKILHPTCILPAQKKRIPVRLLNTMQPTAAGTLITEKSSNTAVTAIAAKDNIIAIKIKSSRMLLAYGFLRKVFEVFEKYKTPIDMITTSEVAVSLTIDNAKHLEDIIKELKSFCSVEVDKEMSIVCIVGNFTADKNGYASKVFESLKEIPIRMISYGGSEHNISVLINSDNKKKALIALNEGLF